MALCDYIETALGKHEADLVIKEARIVNVNTHETYRSDIVIKRERIVLVGDSDAVKKANRTIDARAMYAVPGFIDAHLHIESSMLTPSEFSSVVTRHGTATVVWDPHEIVNVAGLQALRTVIKETERLPLHIYFVVPSCVPSAPGKETSGAQLTAAATLRALKLPRVIGLGELMDFPGVLACSASVMRKVNGTRRMHLVIDGHAPRLRGKELSAYIASGVGSDHESTSQEEGLEKLQLGMWLMIRESSTSRDLHSLIKPLIKGAIDSRHCMFVSDDRTASDLLLEGHMDHILRKAMSEGMDPITAIQLATINPATYTGLGTEVGSISPGRLADVLLLSDLEKVRIERVIIGGKELDGDVHAKPPIYPKRLTRTVRLKRKPDLSDFTLNVRNGRGEVDVNVIRLNKGTLLTSRETRRLAVKDGIVEISGDVMCAMVFERHTRTGNIGKGFLTGIGTPEGALAQSIAHDSHNLIAVGSNPLDMLNAIGRISTMQGGIAVSSKGVIVASLQLSVAGLMALESAKEVANKIETIEKAAFKLGFEVESPITALSFLSLPVIPSLRLTDLGLFDVDRGIFIPPLVKQKS